MCSGLLIDTSSAEHYRPQENLLLQYPHVSTVLAKYQTVIPNWPTRYIFTELAPGGDLFSYIDSKNGTLSDLQSRVISRQIVLAIQYMHRQGVAHRDIKPENVLIMQTDFGGRVVLTDFGFANYIHQSGRLNSRLGTSGFIAP